MLIQFLQWLRFGLIDMFNCSVANEDFCNFLTNYTLFTNLCESLSNCTTRNETCCDYVESCNLQNITISYSITNSCAQDNTCPITTETIVFMTFCCIVIAFVVIGNCFVIQFQLTVNRKRTNMEILIMYLSFFDLLASIMLIMDVYDNLTCFSRWPLGSFGCKTIYPLYHVSLNMSVAILIIMSIDRCRAIVSPIKRKFPKKSLHITVLVSVIISVALQWYQINGYYIVPYKNGWQCRALRAVPLYAIPRIIIVTTRDVAFIIIFTVTSIMIYHSLLKTDIPVFYQERKKKETYRVVIVLIVMEAVFALLVLPYDVFDCVMSISRVFPGANVIKVT